MMKNILKSGQRILLYVVLILMMVPSMSLMAAEKIVIIKVGETEGEKGDQISIPVNIENGEEVCGIEFTITYDADEIYFENAKKGDALRIGGMCDINPLEGKNQVKFVYAGLTGLKEDGGLCTLNFEVLSGSTHTVEVEVQKILNYDIEELPYEVKGGKEIEAAETQESVPANRNGESPESSTTNEEDPKAQSGQENEADASMGSDDTTSQKKKRKIVVKTENGMEDITASTEHKAVENEASANETESKRRILTIIGLCGACILVLAAAVMLKIKRRRREDEKEMDSNASRDDNA